MYSERSAASTPAADTAVREPRPIASAVAACDAHNGVAVPSRSIDTVIGRSLSVPRCQKQIGHTKRSRWGYPNDAR